MNLVCQTKLQDHVKQLNWLTQVCLDSIGHLTTWTWGSHRLLAHALSLWLKQRLIGQKNTTQSRSNVIVEIDILNQLKKVVDFHINSASLKSIELQLLIQHELTGFDTDSVSVLMVGSKEFAQDGIGKGFGMVAHLILECLIKSMNRAPPLRTISISVKEVKSKPLPPTGSSTIKDEQRFLRMRFKINSGMEPDEQSSISKNLELIRKYAVLLGWELHQSLNIQPQPMEITLKLPILRIMPAPQALPVQTKAQMRL